MRGAEEVVHRGVGMGIFEIDAQGRVWRIAHQQTSRWGGKTEIIECKRHRAENGHRQRYLQVRLMLGNVRYITAAHRLIWFHFNGAIPADLTINHINGRKKDNRPENLELATRSEQSLHACHVLGFQPRKNLKGNFARGVDNGTAKLTPAWVRRIRMSKRTGLSYAKQLGVSIATISRVRSGKLWRHIT